MRKYKIMVTPDMFPESRRKKGCGRLLAPAAKMSWTALKSACESM